MEPEHAPKKRDGERKLPDAKFREFKACPAGEDGGEGNAGRMRRELVQTALSFCRRLRSIEAIPFTTVTSRGLRIPTQSGHRFRFDAGHRSDLKPATIPK